MLDRRMRDRYRLIDMTHNFPLEALNSLGCTVYGARRDADECFIVWILYKPFGRISLAAQLGPVRLTALNGRSASVYQW